MADENQVSEILRKWMDTFSHRSMREWVRFAKSTGMSLPQFGILSQLHHRGPCGVSDISERMDISNAAASQLVDKLVQAGLLERTEDLNDRRAKHLTLSAAGHAVIEKGIRERGKWMNELAFRLSEGEQQKVAEALQILIKAAEKLTEQEKENSQA